VKIRRFQAVRKGRTKSKYQNWGKREKERALEIYKGSH
jgi:hypothetical protein